MVTKRKMAEFVGEYVLDRENSVEAMEAFLNVVWVLSEVARAAADELDLELGQGSDLAAAWRGYATRLEYVDDEFLDPLGLESPFVPGVNPPGRRCRRR